MEPNKLETQFKEQLNSREIKPSKMAWSKLDAMLAAAELSNSEQVKQKPKTKFPWLFIAASFVGFLLIGTVFFKGFETVKISTDTPVVLEQKTDVNTLNEPEISNETVLSTQIQKNIIKEQGVVADNISAKKQTKRPNAKNEEVITLNPSKENNAIASSFENRNHPVKNDNRYVSAEKLLAEVSNTAFEPKATTKAIEKIKKSIAINPSSLLSNAETELNQSFRESALDKFNKNFNAIKTVLVNRNYEE